MDPTMIALAHRVSDKALSWLGRYRSCFALPPDVPEYEINGNAFKALSELALTMGLIRRESVFGPRGADIANSLLEFSWREFGAGELLYRLQAYTPAATFPLEIYSMFAAAGYRHAALEELLTPLSGLRAWRVPEHLPNRQLAVLAAARRVGLPPHGEAAGLTALTWLGGKPEPWMLDANNAYGLTHTVFHLTDWGADPEGLPQELEDYLHQWLPVWVEVFNESRFWDLLSEFLIVGTCLRRPLFYPQVWTHIAQAQRDDGMLPNGITRPSDTPELAFRNHYHPTVVAVIAATLTVSRGLHVAAASDPERAPERT